VDLVSNGARWIGGCPNPEGVTRTFVQVVDGAGNVTIGDWQRPPTLALNAPDLIIESVVATPEGIQIVIRNIGTATVTADHRFWVDAYLAPDPPPATEDDTWNDGRSEYGAMWRALGPIPPGGTLVLTTDDAFYFSEESLLPETLPLGAIVYAQADSANTATTYGAVEETHELGGGSYNNIFGPIMVQESGRFTHPEGAAATRDTAAETWPARPE